MIFLDDVTLFETFIFCTWCFFVVVPLIFATLLYSIFASILNLSILKIENSSLKAFYPQACFLLYFRVSDLTQVILKTIKGRELQF